jgi:hypothetical protein
MLHSFRTPNAFRLVHREAETERRFLDWRRCGVLAAAAGTIGLSDYSDDLMPGGDGALESRDSECRSAEKDEAHRSSQLSAISYQLVR